MEDFTTEKDADSSWSQDCDAICAKLDKDLSQMKERVKKMFIEQIMDYSVEEFAKRLQKILNDFREDVGKDVQRKRDDKKEYFHKQYLRSIERYGVTIEKCPVCYNEWDKESTYKLECSCKYYYCYKCILSMIKLVNGKPMVACCMCTKKSEIQIGLPSHPQTTHQENSVSLLFDPDMPM